MLMMTIVIAMDHDHYPQALADHRWMTKKVVHAVMLIVIVVQVYYVMVVMVTI